MAWIAIILAKERRTKKQIPTTSLVPTIASAGTNKNIPNQTSNKARPIEYLRDCLKTNPVVNIVADSRILEIGTYDFSVTCAEYFRLLRKQTTDASCLATGRLLTGATIGMIIAGGAYASTVDEATFGGWLFSATKVVNPFFALLDPEVAHRLDVSAAARGKHWVLLVISLRNRIVYILDSLKDRIEKSADYHYLLKKHVDMAFMRYEKDTSTPIGWIFAECNQQLGGLESGHFVMRLMFDFLTTRQHGFPCKSGSIWNDKSAFEEKVLLATVSTWSREFLNNYMKDVVLRKKHIRGAISFTIHLDEN
ncbi:unnamed protein product [Lactuca virosa]|uniref:Ubiquitin-like protease family profile domain-containing protein n=1 Tax=Lactuca virosa TaxID=75947 RepID=A0AAU9NDZ4_9ASTR|nr:unnamed protein product [Lactuca virosa]